MFKKFKKEEKGEVVGYLLILFAVLSLLWVYAPSIKNMVFGATDDSVAKVDEITKPMEDKPDTPSTGEQAPPVIEKPVENLSFCALDINKPAYNQKPAGHGQKSSPYQIKTIQELQWLNELDGDANTTCYVEIVNDIDASETKTWEDGKGFDPLSISGYNLKMNLDGKNHTISNLYINRWTRSYIGLFGFAYQNVSNLKVKNADITGNQSTGIFAGSITESNIQNIEVQGIVRGNSRIGGAFGEGLLTTVKNAKVNAIIENKAGMIGGLMGYGDGTFDNIRVDATIKTDPSSTDALVSGGLFGVLKTPSTITKTSNKTRITANTISNTASFAGIVTGNFAVNLKDSYVYTTMEAKDLKGKTGYFIGSLTSTTSLNIENAYSYATLSFTTKPSTTIPVIGDLSAKAKASNFYFNEDNPLYEKSSFGTPVTMTQMKDASTFKGFDFTNVWTIDPNQNRGYPILKQQQ